MSRPARIVFTVLGIVMLAPIIGAAWLAMLGVKIVSYGLIITAAVIGALLLIGTIGGKK